MGNSTKRKDAIAQAKRKHRAGRNFISPYRKKERGWRRGEAAVSHPASTQDRRALREEVMDMPLREVHAYLETRGIPLEHDVPSPEELRELSLTSTKAPPLVVAPPEEGWELATLKAPNVDFAFLSRKGGKRDVFVGFSLMESAGIDTSVLIKGTPFHIRVDEGQIRGPRAVGIKPFTTS